MSSSSLTPTRRSLLKGAGAAAALPFIGALTALHAREAMAAGTTQLIASPYGPIAPVNDLTTGLPLLQLPPGFSYKSFGWTGDLMANGKPTPSSHDGMAVVVSRKVGRGTELVLVRNHERASGSDTSFFGAPGVYDQGRTGSGSSPYSAGGTTNLTFRDGNWIKTEPSLGGTRTNCAGGPTPWGTWLSCEEVGSDAVSDTGKKHGYVFEVTADPAQTTGQPIVGMGRFAHEAAGVDPATGTVYLTEDSSGKSGLYRYLPTNKTGAPGALAQGGLLQMAKVKGQINASIIGAQLDDTVALEWVDVPNPDQNRGNAIGPGGATVSSASGPFVQGWQQGGLRMNRGEGVWYFEGKMYFMDTSGGPVSQGTIWELNLASQVMVCIYSSPSLLVGTMGDNITVSPRGGLLICEDGGNVTDQFGPGLRLMGLAEHGEVFIFAKNNIQVTASQLTAAGKSSSLSGDHRSNEFAGGCFDPTGRYLFVNIQTPGVTFAITGPWAQGSL
jgi:secreted PhoX family phosphatase